MDTLDDEQKALLWRNLLSIVSVIGGFRPSEDITKLRNENEQLRQENRLLRKQLETFTQTTPRVARTSQSEIYDEDPDLTDISPTKSEQDSQTSNVSNVSFPKRRLLEESLDFDNVKKIRVESDVDVSQIYDSQGSNQHEECVDFHSLLSNKKINLTGNPKMNRPWYREDFTTNPEYVEYISDRGVPIKMLPPHIHSSIREVCKYEINASNLDKYLKTYPNILKSDTAREWEVEDSLQTSDVCADFLLTQEVLERNAMARERSGLKGLQMLFQACLVVEGGKQVGKYVFKKEEYNTLVCSGNFVIDLGVFA
ncbi:unnamed protein product [Pichia kudriavzevii]